MRSSILPLLLFGALATGCATATADVADVPAAKPTPDAVSVADGDHFGFLVAVTTNPAAVTIDPAVWVDDDAEPNGYRIDDPGLDPIDLPLASDAVIEILQATGDPSTTDTVTVDELQTWFTDLGQPDETAPFDVVVSDGEVTELRFIYRP